MSNANVSCWNCGGPHFARNCPGNAGAVGFGAPWSGRGRGGGRGGFGRGGARGGAGVQQGLSRRQRRAMQNAQGGSVALSTAPAAVPPGQRHGIPANLGGEVVLVIHSISIDTSFGVATRAPAGRYGDFLVGLATGNIGQARLQQLVDEYRDVTIGSMTARVMGDASAAATGTTWVAWVSEHATKAKKVQEIVDAERHFAVSTEDLIHPCDMTRFARNVVSSKRKSPGAMLRIWGGASTLEVVRVTMAVLVRGRID